MMLLIHLAILLSLQFVNLQLERNPMSMLQTASHPRGIYSMSQMPQGLEEEDIFIPPRQGVNAATLCGVA
jgi:hypothetical protein